MVLPPPSTSRLSALKNARNSLNRSRSQPQQQLGITDYLKRTHPSPQQQPPQRASSAKSSRQKNPILSETQNSPVHAGKILDGVVACLDVRTEDGDDVSQNFERALQSMGAKTRRTFSDSITHLIFKNGSPATLKKALSKNVYIINLLWISRCKREGKHVPEKEFIIERPQGLVLAGKKRRKSMEPGKVRALVMDELMQTSLSSSSEGSMHDEMDARRKTVATSSSAWEARDFNKEGAARKRMRYEELEDEDPSKGVAADIKLNPPRLSLPISMESIASKHIKPNPPKNIIPIHAPSVEMKEQIKARFSIGSKSPSLTDLETSALPTTSASTTTASPSVKSSQSLLSTPVTTPLRRKRRLTGNLSRPTLTPSASSSTSLPPLEKLDIIPKLIGKSSK